MLNDSLLASGNVQIFKVFSDRKELIWTHRNTLTTSFFTTIPQLLAGQVGTLIGDNSRTVADGTAKWVTYMKVGFGSTPAAVSDNDLEDPSQGSGTTDYILPISTVSFENPATGSVSFSATLPTGTGSDDYNTTPLTEVGLYSETDLLLARQVYTDIAKTETFQLQYTWTITFRS